MKNIFNTSSLDSRLLSILLRPSWFSGTFAVVTTLGVVGGTIILSQFKGSSIQLYYQKYQSSIQPDVHRSVDSGLLNNQFISNLPLLMFWAIVGIVVYLLAVNVFAAIRNTAELKSELDYENIDRHGLLATAGVHFLVRLVVLITWVFYINFFFDKLLPYCITATLAGLSQMVSFEGVGYILLASIALLLSIHLHAIMLRLLMLRPRAFTKALYVD